MRRRRIGQADKKVDFITILFVSTVCSAAAVRGREREPFPSRLNGPRLYLLTISWEGERESALQRNPWERGELEKGDTDIFEAVLIVSR